MFTLAFTILVQPDIGWLERVAGDGIVPGQDHAQSKLNAVTECAFPEP
jgi:hypothetical protein